MPPIWYVLTVLAARDKNESAEQPDTHSSIFALRGLYMGFGRDCFSHATALSRQVNVNLLDEPVQKAVVYLSPEEYRSTWLGNKSVYRMRMAMADNAELLVIGPGLECFGEDSGIDVLLIDYKKYSSYEIESMLVKKLKEMKIDYILLAGFLKKLSPLFISSYRNKIINIHPSLLPKYKGLNAIKQAIDNNDREIGVTVHYVDEKLDNGPIIVQDSINVEKLSEEETYEKIHELEHKLYVEAINKVMEES